MNQANHFRGTQEQMEVLKQDFSRVVVVGSCKPLSHAPVCQSPSVEKEEREKEQKKIKGNPDPLARDNVNSDALHGPALRICGKLARWTGNSEDKQGEVGIDAEVLFEALTGEIASSHLELYNEGSTAIFYSWEKLCMPNSFPNLIKTYPTHFYFNTSSDVILPGVTKRMEILFKAVRPGIETEKWRLKTHPLLLGGASMLVTLTGFALYQDKNAEQRLFIKTKLEKRVTVKLCRSIVDERVQGIHTPERPSSPAELYTTELYTTEEQQFLSKNPKLQFVEKTVEDLKKLWHEVNPGHAWDLSVDTLRQAVLAHPDKDSVQEKSLAKLNSLYLQLCEPPVQKHKYPTAAAVGRLLWRKLLDQMDDEARSLKNMLGLKQRGKPSGKNEESLILDEISEKKEGAVAREKRSGPESRLKEEESNEMGKRFRGKEEKESNLLTDTQTENISQPEAEQLELTEIYRRLLHQKVYAGILDLVDNLCAMVDELH